MKLRLTGTRQECAAAVTALATGFVLHEVSGFYPNRGGSLLGRVYAEVEIRPDTGHPTPPGGGEPA